MLDSLMGHQIKRQECPHYFPDGQRSADMSRAGDSWLSRCRHDRRRRWSEFITR